MAASKFQSSFLSSQKDCEAILQKIFMTSKPYSDNIKKLLVINTPDCLDNQRQSYIQAIKYLQLSDLKEQGYIRLVPKLRMEEHEEVKSYIIISFDNFMATSNPKFRDCTVSFDIVCHTDCWDLGNFRLRPLQIAGYIDGILNNTKLTGIGTLEFLGCKEFLLDENWAG